MYAARSLGASKSERHDHCSTIHVVHTITSFVFVSLVGTEVRLQRGYVAGVGYLGSLNATPAIPNPIHRRIADQNG